ncbi:MAG: Beta-ketoacyl-[acyl-carrier-protein] synthase [Pseudonocardiales bacterium]|nr:Beta-ketoacyl-[acyl-carrier-protein] synthase [Pseudonocardiales bacterium]
MSVARVVTLSGPTPPTAYAGARLMGLGAAQPVGSISGTELGAPFGRTADWIEARTGIRELRRLGAEENLIDLAVDAGKAALAASGLVGDDIDLIIATSCSTRLGDAALGAQLSERLNPNAAQFDLNAACSGFCYAVSTAEAMIRTGAARHVLIVAAENMSGLIDPKDLGTSIIFGDGAGAAVIGPAPDENLVGIGPVVWGSDGDGANMIAFGPDGTDEFMRMQGQSVFRWATESVPDIALQACDAVGVSPGDIDVFVPHQANLRIIESVVRKAGFERAIIATDVVGSGNTSSASIPIALTRLLESGQATSGQRALLVGFGAGLAYAAQVVRIP